MSCPVDIRTVPEAICAQLHGCPQIAGKPPIWILTRVDLKSGRPRGVVGAASGVAGSAFVGFGAIRVDAAGLVATDSDVRIIEGKRDRT